MADTNKKKNTQYSPSWIDRLNDWVGGLPGSRWGYYLGFGILLLIVQSIVLWVENATLVGTFLSVHLFLSAAIPFILAITAYFDHRAGVAFEGMRTSLTAEEKEYQRLRYRLTTLPGLKTILSQILGVGVALFIEKIGSGAYQLEELSKFPISAAFLRIFYLVCWFFYGGFIYHTVRQLSLINLIYTQLTRINLYRQKHLYGFSNLTAWTAGSMILLPYGFMLVEPNVTINDPVVLGFYVVITLIAVATFITPQLGLHSLQSSEKSRVKGEVFIRYEAMVAEIHQRMDEGDYIGASDLNAGFASLDQEINMINKTPTWPWQPETVRWLVTALVLPLGLWLIQYFIQQTLSN